LPTHHERRELPFSKDQLFDLVANFEKYPEFLPWCVAARTKQSQVQINPEGQEVVTLVAELAVRFKMFREKFTTRDILNKSAGTINIKYIDGPFHHLDNDWKFEATPSGCIIDFYIDFEFRSRFLQSMMASLFEKAVHKMISAFEARAHEVYDQVEAASVQQEDVEPMQAGVQDQK
jgi:coenzyme Q-binding protein COQ10